MISAMSDYARGLYPEAGPTVKHTGGIMPLAGGDMFKTADMNPYNPNSMGYDPKIANSGTTTTSTGVVGTGSNSGTGGASGHVGLNPIFGDYINDYLSKGSALAGLPFAPYEGDRFAGPSQLQQQAFQGAGNLNPTVGSGNPLLQAGAGIISTAGGAYNPSFMSGNTAFQGAQKGIGDIAKGLMGTVGASPATQFTPGSVGASNVSVDLDAGDWGTVQKYMSPYQQAVNDVTKRRMQEEFAKQDMARKAAAVKAGAFGGSRFAIENSEAAKNQNTQISDMDVQGMQRAYDAAQQALSGQRGAQLQAGISNQNANLQASMESARQALQAQQLQEQSRQFGLNFGLSGLNSAAGLYGTLGNLALAGTSADNRAGLDQANLGIGVGGALANIGDRFNQQDAQRFNQQQQAIQTQAGLGALEQKFAQDPLDFGYQQWQESLKYPQEQIKFQQGLMAGLPLSYSGGGGENPWLAALQGGVGTYDLLEKLLKPK